MEIQDLNTKKEENMWEQWEADHKRGKRIGGLFIVIVGALFLARELGSEIPDWVFSWKMLLIGIGLFVGIKHGFRRWGWIFPVIIGSVFLATDLFPALTIKPLLWPIVVIIFGLVMIFKPRRKWGHRRWRKWHKHNHRWHQHHHSGYYKDYQGRNYEETTSDSDSLDFSVVCGNIKRNVISKNFRGGEMNIVLAGGELNLSQADINGTVNIEINAVLGGAKLIIPPNWTVRSELSSVMGSIEDKRQMNTGTTPDANKVLILEGNVCMGGIDIVSY
jgi:predicted membrane protein